MRGRILIVAVVCSIMSASALAQTSSQPAQRKVIKDPAEYNAYVTALRPNPQQKAILMEAFVQQYPNSVVKVDALEQLMAAYEQSGNSAKTMESANRLLQADPNNIRALALLAYSARSAAEQGQNPQANSQQAEQYGQRGLQALQSAAKPVGVSDADWLKLKTQTEIIFHGAMGFGALQTKNYPVAQQNLQAAVDLRAKESPNDTTAIRDIYPLALAYLQTTPVNPLGLWYVARAADLSNQNPQIVEHGRNKYLQYHGSEQGWELKLKLMCVASDHEHCANLIPGPTKFSLENKGQNKSAVLHVSKGGKDLRFTVNRMEKQ